MDATPCDSESVVADECHIHSPRGGPRHNPQLDPSKVDEYENLILLCRTHHKLVDDQERTFPSQDLRDMKRTHEKWVRETLEPRKPRDKSVAYGVLLATGKEVADMVASANYARDFDHDPIETEEEADIVGGFLQHVTDLGYIWDDLEPIQRVTETLRLNAGVSALEAAGFLVIGAKCESVADWGGKRVSLPTCVLRVLRRNNTAIVSRRATDE